VKFLDADVAGRAGGQLARVTLTLADDAHFWQQHQYQGYAGEQAQDIEYVHDYGMTCVPNPQVQGATAAAEAIVAFLGGNRSHGVVVKCGDRRSRVMNLPAGDVCFHRDNGVQLHLTATGLVISTPNTMQIKHQVMTSPTVPPATPQPQGATAQMGQGAQALLSAVTTTVHLANSIIHSVQNALHTLSIVKGGSLNGIVTSVQNGLHTISALASIGGASANGIIQSVENGLHTISALTGANNGIVTSVQNGLHTISALAGSVSGIIQSVQGGLHTITALGSGGASGIVTSVQNGLHTISALASSGISHVSSIKVSLSVAGCSLGVTSSGIGITLPGGGTMGFSASGMSMSGAAGIAGQIASSTGFQTMAGTGGATLGNSFNVGWNGTAASLWIDAMNLGQILTASDYRIKTNVEPLPSMWDRAKLLRPISYNHKDFGVIKGDDVERWGFVAHELQETLIPDAATGSKDQEHLIQSPNAWTVIATLTRALQEAMARIEALEGKADLA
jgi:phage gp45-like